jgi:hypothetical protein
MSIDLETVVVMDFGEFVLCDSDGTVTGCDTNRVIAEFSKVDEGESFAEIYNEQLLRRGDTSYKNSAKYENSYENDWIFSEPVFLER